MEPSPPSSASPYLLVKPNKPDHGHFYQILLLSLSLIITFALYSYNLPGFFLHDDLPSILQNESVKITELTSNQLIGSALSNTSGPLKRPVSALTFGLNYYFSDKTFDSANFKRFNIYLHLLNGILIFYLVTLVTQLLNSNKSAQYSWLPLIVTSAWLLHPIQVSTAFYAVQRMTELATLFSLLGLISYLKIRINHLYSINYRLLLTLFFTLFFLLAIFSKESGVLLPVYCLVLELTIISSSTIALYNRRFVQLFFLLFLIIPAMLGGFHLFNSSVFTNGYDNRSFTLIDRLLTEPGIIIFYIKSILIPTYTEYRFIYDFPLVKSLFSPISALLSVISIVSLIAISLYLRKIYPLFAFGILFFFSGHLLESTALPLELAYEHRNYLPSFALLLASFTLMHSLFKQFDKKFLLISLISYLLFVTANTSLRLSNWHNYQDFAIFQATNFPDSYSAQYHMGKIYASAAHTAPVTERNKLITRAIQQYRKSYILKPESIAPITAIVMLQSQHKLPINKDDISYIKKQNGISAIHSHDIIALKELMNCQLENNCHFTAQEIQQIFEPLLVNTHLGGKHKTVILLSISQYMSKLGHYQNALSLAYDATINSPKSADTKIYLIDLLIFMNMISEANKQIEIYLKNDKFGQIRDKFIQKFGHLKQIIINNPLQN